MRASKVLAVVSMFALMGCPLFDFGEEEKDKTDGTSNEAAASALTKGASFEGGELVTGLMPDTTLPEVTLLGDDATAEPGEVTLLSFDAENPDQKDDPVTTALMQFAGSEDHFEVLIDSPEEDGDKVSFKLALKLDGSVCKTLCNQVFEVKLQHAAQTKGGGIGDHGDLTLKLDCTKKGNPDLCDGSSEDKGGDTAGTGTGTGNALDAGGPVLPGAGTGGGTDKQFRSLDLTNEILANYCKACGAEGAACVPYNAEYRACVQDAFSRFASEVEDYATCSDTYFEAQLECVMGADCTAVMNCDYFSHGQDPIPDLQACGGGPTAFRTELDKCEALNAGAGTAGEASHGNDGGTPLVIDAGPAAGLCEADCNVAAGGSDCMCNAKCGTMELQLMCTGGLCTCLANGKETMSFDNATCSADPSGDEWLKCGFPTLP